MLATIDTKRIESITKVDKGKAFELVWEERKEWSLDR